MQGVDEALMTRRLPRSKSSVADFDLNGAATSATGHTAAERCGHDRYDAPGLAGSTGASCATDGREEDCGTDVMAQRSAEHVIDIFPPEGGPPLKPVGVRMPLL